MDNPINSPPDLVELVMPAVKAAIRDALIRHKKLGETIVILRDGQIVELTGDEIPVTELDPVSDGQNP